jgi:hypothetical protein
MIDRLILATLEQHPRNLCEWPGKGCDSPLYDFGAIDAND